MRRPQGPSVSGPHVLKQPAHGLSFLVTITLSSLIRAQNPAPNLKEIRGRFSAWQKSLAFGLIWAYDEFANLCGLLCLVQFTLKYTAARYPKTGLRKGIVGANFQVI